RSFVRRWSREWLGCRFVFAELLGRLDERELELLGRRLNLYGGECRLRQRGIAPRILRDWLNCGNLRNGSNAGSSYLNCRNGLTNANWNYLAAECLRCYILYCSTFRSEKL